MYFSWRDFTAQRERKLNKQTYKTPKGRNAAHSKHQMQCIPFCAQTCTSSTKDIRSNVESKQTSSGRSAQTINYIATCFTQKQRDALITPTPPPPPRLPSSSGPTPPPISLPPSLPPSTSITDNPSPSNLTFCLGRA